MGAVKNAMQRDELDPTIMDLDHDRSVASQRKSKEEEEEDGPPLKEDPKYQKYFKMLKMVSHHLFDLYESMNLFISCWLLYI
jgi:hypothetical protein